VKVQFDSFSTKSNCIIVMVWFLLLPHIPICISSQETFNAAHETERKRALSALYAQTKQQERKDAEVRDLVIVILWSSDLWCFPFLRFYSYISDPQVLHFQVLAEAKRIMESRAASKVSKSVHCIPYFLSRK
jgi:hypothetical protein